MDGPSFITDERNGSVKAISTPLSFPQGKEASGGPFFSVLPEKNGEKRGAGVRNSAYAPKKYFVFAHHSSKLRLVKERPSGGAFDFVYGNVPARQVFDV